MSAGAMDRIAPIGTSWASEEKRPSSHIDYEMKSRLADFLQLLLTKPKSQYETMTYGLTSAVSVFD